MEAETLTKRFEIRGVVQGVGFRPFLFRLAHHHQLNGEVFNSGQGVTLILEGAADAIERYHEDIFLKKPPIAIITAIDITPLAPGKYSTFQIVQSKEGPYCKAALISPDVSACDDCLGEMHDLDDRRHGYPFINCTNCGPRYTIIKDVPYDRPKTSMAVFPMCSQCQDEYNDPLNRRFHAQPNACPVCGPHLFFLSPSKNSSCLPPVGDVDNEWELSSNVASAPDLSHQNDTTALENAASLLCQGKILAVKGLGGFHLAVDGLNTEAIIRLRQRKQRPDKPLALMVKTVEVVAQLVHISDDEKKILTSHSRPILLLAKRNFEHGGEEKHRKPSCHLSKETLNIILERIAPANRSIGVMLPYTPLHALLLEKGPPILVMTSGNRSGEPLSIDNDDALDAFSHIADGFLMHNRDIYFRADDSIVQYQSGKQRFIRRSRGYAPIPVFLKKKMKHFILACGGGLKSTVCLAKKDQAFLSPHIGDLDNAKVFNFYQESIEHLTRILDISPDIVAHDLHPGYMSTAYAVDAAQRWAGGGRVMPVRADGITGDEDTLEGKMADIASLPLVAVQHHHAHALSCMAENGLEGEVIAVTLDGTGLGTDGHIWGGEVLVCDAKGFERKAHLSYLPMPGGDAAVKEPWRMAVSALYHAWGDDFIDLDLPLLETIEKEKVAFLIEMMKRGIHSPLTSSCGRLFDAVSSLLSLCQSVSFEGQAAMALEARSANPFDGGYVSYPFEWLESAWTTDQNEPCSHEAKGLRTPSSLEPMSEISGMRQIVTAPMIKAVALDILSGSSSESVGARFHLTLIEIFTEAVRAVRRETGLHRVVLSGGVFHNSYLLFGLVDRLEKEKMMVYTHSQVPCGDGGISLGQILAADAAVG